MADDILTRLHNYGCPMDGLCNICEAAIEIETLRADREKLLSAYKYLRDLVDEFAQHCKCENSSATMFILHRAAMKHDPWSLHKESPNGL